MSEAVVRRKEVTGRAVVAQPAKSGAAAGEAVGGGGAKRTLVIAAFAATYLIWGSTYLGIKYAIETLPPLLMSGFRFTVAGAALLAWAWRAGAERPTRKHWLAALTVGGLLFLGGNGGVVWAEQHIASGLAALLVATEPLWIVVLNWARPGGSRPTVPVLAGLMVGFLGVWLLIGPGGTAGAESGGSLAGAAVVLLASISWAVGSLYSMRAPVPRSPILAAGMQMLAGGVLLALAGTASGEWSRLDLGNVSAVSVGAMLYLVVFGSVVAFTAYSWLLKVVPPARAATYAYVNPVVAVLLGWAVAGEPLGWRTMTAAAAIVGSVILMTGFEGARKRSESC